MSSYVRCVLAAVFLFAGCAGGAEITGPPTRLAEVNQILEGTDARIVWRSGERVERAEYVRLTRDSIWYRMDAAPGEPSRWEVPTPVIPEDTIRSRPIHEVQRIEAFVGGGGGTIGLAVGAAPGLILMTTSFVAGVTQDCEEASTYCGLGAVLGLYWGAIGALGGGVVGGVVGELSDQDRRVIYQSPVSQYLKQ